MEKAFGVENTVPLINCGQELCEIQPMNLGLLNDENGKYVLPKNDPQYGRLAFFDPFKLNWLYDGDMPEKTAEIINKRRSK
ncbi:MAG: maltodextrin glycosyltransferase, partial [Clostridia bacterium]|nr:maltodextrin glycosyltransferase [Clostridia bacterium]